MNKILWKFSLVLAAAMVFAFPASASEADIVLPSLSQTYDFLGGISGYTLLKGGIIIAILGMLYGFHEFMAIKAMPVHKSISDVSDTIYETCKTYLFQQSKLLLLMEVFIGLCIFYYFFVLQDFSLPRVLTILSWSVVGILGSFGVAWFGIRINTWANCRTAFASLKGEPYPVMSLPLRSGMSIGVVLICVELFMMLSILCFVNPENAGSCFIGFAIGESLGASALRICGGIFTKIADIGSDLMKIVFKIKEDDARNPGVIADCTGDNAGDSVGPTADGFETYGVTGVALIVFIVLAVGTGIDEDGNRVATAIGEATQAQLIVWIFTMRVLMILTSVLSYHINRLITSKLYKNVKSFNFEVPLTSLVWLTSVTSIVMTFVASYFMIGDIDGDTDLWIPLATIISCGTLTAALIPELTKAFTSSKSMHVQEIVDASREGGASLTILAGIISGNFSAFWKGLALVGIMTVAVYAASFGLAQHMIYPTVFAFGLVAFGMLGVGPVTIAVDSYGPVADNAQSVFELSQIEEQKGISEEIRKEFGFKPAFKEGKEFLEENDSAGNTFKATAKPVLIGTAVIGATTMIFSIILLLSLNLNILEPAVLLGFIAGGAVIYWFSGASMQAVSTGAYRAVEFIKKTINLDTTQKAPLETSKEVVEICTRYAQLGMINIFGAVFCFSLAFAFFNPTFFAAYLVSIAIFGLFQAIFMANAGGAWDNAKKVVEVDLKDSGSKLHEAVVVGDTVGDPFKDTSSVALNPIIKFTTLFGLLAAEIAVSPVLAGASAYIGIVFLILALVFVLRSFYGMRIKVQHK